MHPNKNSHCVAKCVKKQLLIYLSPDKPRSPQIMGQMASVLIQCWFLDTLGISPATGLRPTAYPTNGVLGFSVLLCLWHTTCKDVSEPTSRCHNLSNGWFWVLDPSRSKLSDLLVLLLPSPYFWLLQDLAPRTLTCSLASLTPCLPVITQHSTHSYMPAGVPVFPDAGIPDKGVLWSPSLITGSWASMHTEQRPPHSGKKNGFQWEDRTSYCSQAQGMAREVYWAITCLHRISWFYPISWGVLPILFVNKNTQLRECSFLKTSS